jgi:glycosyltransferase involved in cell wall biosynthesis
MLNVINKRFSALIALWVCLFFSPLSSALVEKPLVVIIPSYKNVKYCEKNLESVFTQNYSNYRVIYIDDCSPDETFKAVEKYVQEKNQGFRVKAIKNSERSGAMANIYWAVHTCREHEICILLDGDDWLSHNEVFNELNQTYGADVWFTHGTLIEYPQGNVTWSEPISPDALANKTYRQYKCPSHLRTFYAWLFKRIKLHDFLYQGKFLSMAWDMAIMYPLAEMAEERHAFISNVNYVYNMGNPINDNKVDPAKQNFLDKLIRHRKPYQRVDNPDIPRWMMGSKEKR